MVILLLEFKSSLRDGMDLLPINRSDVKNDNAGIIQRKGMNKFITNIMKLSGERRAGSQQVQTCLERVRTGNSHSFLVVGLKLE